MKKLFIPMTFVKSGKRFFTDARMVLLFVFLLTFALTEGIIMAVHSDLYGTPILGEKYTLVIAMLADVWLHIFFVRWLVIKEKELKASYVKQRDNHITSLKPFWSVFGIDDSKLMYIDGRIGVLLTMKHGYTYGRPPKHRATHFNGITQFIGELILKGYELRHFNLQVIDPNTAGLDKLQKEVNKQASSEVHRYVGDVYNFIRSVCHQVATVEYEYYLIVGNTMGHVLHLIEDVNLAVGSLSGTLMTDIHIANDKEIYAFIQRYYNINYADVRKLLSSQVYSEKRNIIEVLEYYFSDKEVAASKKVPVVHEDVINDAASAEFDLMLSAAKDSAMDVLVMMDSILNEDPDPNSYTEIGECSDLAPLAVLEKLGTLPASIPQVSLTKEPLTMTPITVSLTKPILEDDEEELL